MTSYTKYHKKYSIVHKDKINEHRKKIYYLKQYGIPVERYDDFIDDFHAHRNMYLKLKNIVRRLNPELVRLLINQTLERRLQHQ